MASRVRKNDHVTSDAQQVLKALRKEWEMGTRDLREASGLRIDVVRQSIGTATRAMKVIPTDVLYQPTLLHLVCREGRFPDQLRRL